jgi:hypothetical protein
MIPAISRAELPLLAFVHAGEEHATEVRQPNGLQDPGKKDL